MRKKAILLALMLMLAVVTPAALAQPEGEKEGVALTVYNSNLAVVKEKRFIELKKGVNTVRFTDVAKSIDATSVHFKSLTDPDGTGVLEQNYEFDLVSSTKLLEKYIDKKIKVITKDGTIYEGTLMSADSAQIVLKDRGKNTLSLIQRADNVKDIQFPELPEGLLTKPTLMWMVTAEKEAKHLTKVTYMTGGISWKADYTVVTNKDDTMLDISGWVTISNYCGATFKDAKIKLVAGDVHRVQPRQYAPRRKGGYEGAGRGSGFQEKAFADYHMYTLQRPATVKDRQVKQIELLNKNEVKVKKIYKYRGAQVAYYGYRNMDAGFGRNANKKINVYLEFENTRKNNMGIPLPKGKIRVYKRDEEDKSLEFIGEDNIDHTPKDEKVKILIGNAFDIVGERKQTNFRRLTSTSMEETFEIKIRNHKKEAVDVEVEEVLYRWVNWEIRDKNTDYVKDAAQKIIFPVKVEPDGEVVIKYTVYYRW
ncbi:MAG: hypothetical protein E3J72_18885 [Planctomycetota bacterium]|nr:MAG: hypothetical protein E3J72_18885 [Planctomycetota bacterium]